MSASTSSITRPDLITKSWHDRATSSYPVSVAYTYEIVVPHSNPLGLSLKTSTISYSIGSKSMVQYISVMDATAPLNLILYTGDIILKVNDISLISTPTNVISYDEAVKAITTAELPRHIKILRLPVINNANSLPSPIELSLFANDPTLTLRFTGVKAETAATDASASSQQHVTGSQSNPIVSQQPGYIKTGSGFDYTLTILDPNPNGPGFPQAITKMARKTKFAWDSNPGCTLVTDFITAPSCNANFFGKSLAINDTFLNQELNCLIKGNASLGAGIYKDRINRYVAVMHVDRSEDKAISSVLKPASPESTDSSFSSSSSKKRKAVLLGENVQSYFIGKYETEADATAAYKFAFTHYRMSGLALSYDYVQKKFRESMFPASSSSSSSIVF